MIWPWSKRLRQTERRLVETLEGLEATTRRLVELDGLCQRQQAELIRLDRMLNTKPKKEEQAPMTQEEQEMFDGLRANNRALRIKLAAAEAIVKDLDAMTISRDEFRTRYMYAAERLTQAHQLLDAAGLLDKLPPVKGEPEREKQSDARTPAIEKGFVR